MVKPVYLYDTNTREMLDVHPNQQPVTIGRALNSNFPTFAGYGGVSRHQADIQYFPHGRILLIHRSSRVITSSGPSVGELEEVSGSLDILPGYFIRFGADYDLRVLPFNDLIVQERLGLRADDTQVLRSGDLT
jgi:hypothetical protein